MSSCFNGGINVSLFGESHGSGIGVVLDNLPAGEPIDLERIGAFMARRAPKKDGTSTTRSEKDIPQILSGLYEGKTTGTPLAAVIFNTDQHSGDYGNISRIARPAHADYTGFLRYNGANDPRGGGHFSGRITAPLCFAGAVCAQILERRGVTTGAHIRSIKGVSDESFDPVNVTAGQLELVKSRPFPTLSETAEEKMREVINAARTDLNSVGGIVECAAVGFPAGIGSPMLDGLENIISRLVFAIPAVKGVEFGVGFDCADMLGSENNDEFAIKNGKIVTKTNNHGGILGGISSGMPIIFRAAFKPTPSVSRPQNSVDFKDMTERELVIKGRHDPCVVPRAVPCVEAALNIALVSALLDDPRI
ncbi:MAG: chorismate synthase [Lachnospiraceae bacterium]|nr:chorismate synthase [Ruminococcus sp.]MCM1275626.1 chorismate synthase [Lachnospiraceae bacterium]